MNTKIEITDAKSVEDLKDKLAYNLKTSPEFLYIYGDSLDNIYKSSRKTKTFIVFEHNATQTIDYILQKIDTNKTPVIIDVFEYVKNMNENDLYDVRPLSDVLYLTEEDDETKPVFMPLYFNKLYKNDSLKDMISLLFVGAKENSNISKLKEYSEKNEIEVETQVEELKGRREEWLKKYQQNIEILQIPEQGDIKFTQEILSHEITMTIDTSRRETQHFNLDVMFNILVLNDDYKLAIYKNLAKIHKDLQHTVNINYNTFNSISIYPKSDNDYSEPEIKVYIDGNNVKITSSNKGTKDTIVQIISELFNLGPEIFVGSAEISNITASINYENRYINKYILLDLILNNKSDIAITSQFETNEKIFTDKMFSSRIFFRTKSQKIIVANVRQICNTVTTNTPHTFKNCNRNLQVSITKCKDADSLSEFLGYFNNLITDVYNRNKESIIQSYNDVGIDINIINDDSELTEKENDVPCKLEQGSEEKQFFATLYPYLFKPEIFLKPQHKDDFRTIEILRGTNYLKSCQKKPIVISEEEALKKIAENGGVIPKSLMKYPENTIEMPVRSDIPRNKSPYIYPMWFYCKNEEDMQKSGDLEKASARKNKSVCSTSIGFMSKNTITPTPGIDTVTKELTYLKLPCCYLENTKRTTSSSKVANPKSTQSLLKKGAQGVLPNLISDLIRVSALETEYQESQFIRYGVVSANEGLNPAGVRDSFFKCMLIATNNERKEDEVKKSLILYTSLAKQSLPDMSVDEIYEKYFSENATEYIDPFYFLQMFEAMFNVSIIVLRRDNFGNDQQITNVVPYYRHLLYKNEYESISKSQQLKRKTVLIYEHRGGAPTPFYSCELIVTTNDAYEIQNFKFISHNTFIENIENIKYYCFDCYSLENKLKTGFDRNNPEMYLWDKIMRFERQYVDEYGKTRQLLGKLRAQEYSEFMFVVNVSPIEPLPIICVSDTKLALTEEIDKLDWDILYSQIYKNIDNTFSTGINSPYVDYSKDFIKGEFGRVKFNIERKISSPSLEKSELDKYKVYKNTALSLKSLFIWLFSKFITDTSIRDTDKTDDNFIKLNTVIVDNCDYNNPTEFLSFEKNPDYFIDNKLKLESRDILNRLFYYLNIARKNKEKVDNYKNRHIIEDYFDNIENYIKFDHQIITPVLSDKYMTNNNIKSLQIMEWIEKIINKSLTDNFGISMLYGEKLAEAIIVLDSNLAHSNKNCKAGKLNTVKYVNFNDDDKTAKQNKTQNNIKIYNNFIKSYIPNKDNYMLDPNKFKSEIAIIKNIKNIYNSIYAIQKFFEDIPGFTNENIKNKILYNNKHKIYKHYQKYEPNVYFHSNNSNSISLCYNTTSIESAIKCGQLWNDTGVFNIENLNNPKMDATTQSIECLFPVNENAHIAKKIQYKQEQNKTTSSSLGDNSNDEDDDPLALTPGTYVPPGAGDAEDDDSVATEYEYFADLEEEEKVPEINDNKIVKIAFMHNSPEITTIMN